MENRQRFTSASTSINKTKLPAIYKWLAKRDGISGKSIIDNGCGAYIDHIENFVNENGAVAWFGMDKYNQTYEHNRNVKTLLSLLNADIGIISNVLNVIDNWDVCLSVVAETKKLSNVVYISIYEGNKTGIGRQTGEDQYQRNEKTAVYADRLKDAGYNVIRKGTIIILK